MIAVRFTLYGVLGSLFGLSAFALYGMLGGKRGGALALRPWLVALPVDRPGHRVEGTDGGAAGGGARRHGLK